MNIQDAGLEGGCTCRYIRYRLASKPLIVHCCHCTWCQRETGSAFVINALFPASDVVHLNGEHDEGKQEPVIVNTPSLSGKGQRIARCPKCHVALWSNYPGAGPAIRFVRVGTLDLPHVFVPDAHIYTGTKVPWVEIPNDAKVGVFEEFYDTGTVWGKDADERRFKVLEDIRSRRAAVGGDNGKSS